MKPGLQGAVFYGSLLSGRYCQLGQWCSRFDLMIGGCPESIYAAVTDLQTVKDRDLSKR